MRQKRTKEQMIERLNKQIAHRKDLLDFYNQIFLPTLQKFDNKVYNIRFIKSLREANDDKLLCVRELENDCIIIEKRFDEFSYNDYEPMYIRVVINKQGRIDANASIEDELGKVWICNFKKEISQMEQIINDYDFYLEKANNVQKVIEEYSKLPHYFRQNIEFRNTFYL